MRRRFLKIQSIIPIFVDTPRRQKQWFLKRRVGDFPFDFVLMGIFCSRGFPLVQKSTVRRRFRKIQSIIPLFVGTPHRQKRLFLKRRVDDPPICAHAASTETHISETPGRRFPYLLTRRIERNTCF